MLIMKRAAWLLAVISITSLLIPSRALAQRVVAVVDVGGGGCVMGGTRDGKWLKSEEMGPLIRGGERYSIYDLTHRVGVKTGGKTEQPGDSCSDTYFVKDLYSSDEPVNLIGIGADWNALPRVPKVESNSSPVYRAVVSALLRRHGIRRPDVKLTKVLRVDLDGDGKEEVLINATRVKRWETGSITPDSNAGDYSVVLVRKVIRGKVETILLDEEYHPKGGRQENEGPPNEYELIGAFDLNGDGRMEVIVQGGYYEGDWKTVYAINGRRAVNLFGCGCGA
ncbi:MAG: hypothetical protein ICV60_06665 [Pyrinomonadaceae bacterium]|nr:hypothetical protein [Pyrinomonadaceae bacterium]